MLKDKKIIDLSYIFYIQSHIQSLKKWISICFNEDIRDKLQQQYFNKYIKVIKPKIHKFNQLFTIINSQKYAFYSNNLSQANIKILIQNYKQLQRFQILDKQKIKLIRQEYQLLTHDDFQKLVQRNNSPFYKIDLNQRPSNQESKYWNVHLPVQKVKVESKVINGKKIANKVLGFPTANLEVTPQIQSKIKELPSGIYFVDFTFTGGQSYYGAGFIGTNPQYQNFNNKRVIQIYVLNDFGQNQFYGANVQVTFFNLIRFQAKFQGFDRFLHAMRNDIDVCQQIKKKIE